MLSGTLIHSGVARIFFSVGGHWGPWIFVGGHSHFELKSPPPPKKKGPHSPAEQSDKQKRSLFCRGGGDNHFQIYKGNKYILNHFLKNTSA